MAKSRKNGVLIPTAPDVVAVPAIAFNLEDLDTRQSRGYEMFRLLGQGSSKTPLRREIDDHSCLYTPTNEKGSIYIVTRKTENRGGTMTIEYACSCLDFKKNLRNGCKHTFCERLARGEATTFGDPPARQPRLSAVRNPPRKRIGSNGLSTRSNQRHARRKMPTRVPEMLDAMRIAAVRRARDANEIHGNDRLIALKSRGGQLTPNTTRATTLILKVSNGLSSDEMHERYQGYINRGVLPLRKPPHPNTISAWMNDKHLEPLLMELFHETTLVYRAQETVGIIDSTKLSDEETSTYRGMQYRGDDRPDARWMKMHALSGLESNAILAFEFSHEKANDILYYEKLVSTAMRTFSLKYVLADRAYLSERTLGWSKEQFGIEAIIPIKKRWNADTKNGYHEVCRAAIDRYDNKRKKFDEIYCFRSKIEAVFSVIKRMFYGYVWSKGRANDGARDGLCQAWRNETICKIIAYNLRCAVIQESDKGIETNFLMHDRFFPAIPMEQRAMQIAA